MVIVLRAAHAMLGGGSIAQHPLPAGGQPRVGGGGNSLKRSVRKYLRNHAGPILLIFLVWNPLMLEYFCVKRTPLGILTGKKKLV